MSAAALGRAAAEIFGEDRVSVAPDLADAIDRAATLAEAPTAVVAEPRTRPARRRATRSTVAPRGGE